MNDPGFGCKGLFLSNRTDGGEANDLPSILPNKTAFRLFDCLRRETLFEPYSARLIVEAELNGVRIDSFLVRHFRNYTTWRMQRLVSAGQVRVNEALASSTQRVFVGETISVRLIEPPDKLLEPEPAPFRLVYQDPWLLVVDKPAGIVAHPTGEFQTGTLANGLQAYLDEQTSVPGLVRPGLPHRLDRQTSGLMVIATHHQSHAGLSVSFEAGRISKSYLAIVEGVISRDGGSIDLPIGRDRADRRVLMSARGDAINPRSAKTPYVVEERFARHTLVRATPLTGRNHQIRVHFAHIGHPLLQDEFYDKHGTFKPWRSDLPDPDTGSIQGNEALNVTGLLPSGRHALHAASLSFAHPITGVWMSFESRLPPDMRRAVQTLQSQSTDPASLVANSPSSG